MEAQEKRITLADGRSLSYLESGEVTGTPLLYMHGNPGSARERHNHDALYKTHHIRFIGVNRPGIGTSSVAESWQAETFADDLHELLQQLRIPQINLMGYSGGGLYACALAAKYPEVVRKLVLVSSVAPFDDEYLYCKLSDANRMFFDAARENPDGLLQQLSAIQDPETILATINSMVNEADKSVLFLPQVKSDLLAAYADVLKQGLKPLVQDLSNIASPWPFSLGAIQADTQLWHGRLDQNSPIESCEYLAERIPKATTAVQDEAAHYFSYPQWQAIIEAI